MKHIGVGLLMSGLVNVEVGSFFYHVKSLAFCMRFHCLARWCTL